MDNKTIKIISYIFFLILFFIGWFYFWRLNLLDNSINNSNNIKIQELLWVNFYKNWNISINWNEFVDYEKLNNIIFDKITVKNIENWNFLLWKKIFNLNTKRLDISLKNTDYKFWRYIRDYKWEQLYINAFNSLWLEWLKQLKNWKWNYLYIDKYWYNNNNIYELTEEDAKELSTFINIKYIELWNILLKPNIKEILKKNSKIIWDPLVYDK